MKKLGQEVENNTVKSYYADGEGGLVIKSETDVSAIIESNKAQYNSTDENARWGDWTKVASIPLAVFQELNEKGICRGFAVVDQKAMKAWLNDPSNKYFRTRPGRV